MRECFPEYYQPTPAEFGRLWESCIFSVDANVLLDVFRYSEATAKALLATLNKLRNRLWLTHQGALEYHRNLASVLTSEAAQYDGIDGKLKAIGEALDKNRGHPFVSAEILKEFKTVVGKLQKELEVRRNVLYNSLTGHPLQSKVGELFSGRIGRAFSATELREIREDGEDRYRRKQPPGYKDEDKGEDPDRKFGDLIMWKEILRSAKERKTDFILVTGDQKEDWFRRVHGRTLGPRPELLREFGDITGQRCYIYDVANFLEHAKEYAKASVATDVIKEARELPPRPQITLDDWATLHSGSLPYAEALKYTSKGPLFETIDRISRAQGLTSPVVETIDRISRAQGLTNPVVDPIDRISRARGLTASMFEHSNPLNVTQNLLRHHELLKHVEGISNPIAKVLELEEHLKFISDPMARVHDAEARILRDTSTKENQEDSAKDPQSIPRLDSPRGGDSPSGEGKGEDPTGDKKS